MAWTTPRTWVAGETVTAAIMNTHIRDNLNALGGAWSTYTPTLTNATLGNGTVVGRYLQVGTKSVLLRIALIAGSTSAGSASPILFSLPLAAHSASEQVLPFKAYNGTDYYTGWALISAGGSSTSALKVVGSIGLGKMSDWGTFATGTVLVFEGIYEAA